VQAKLNIVLALGAGLLGGYLSQYAARYAAPPAVHAQTQTVAPKEIRAQSFVLTDDQGTVVGTFRPSAPRQNELPTVVLLDAWGRETWRGKGAFIRPLGDGSQR
jgi:hypothetical protein